MKKLRYSCIIAGGLFFFCISPTPNTRHPTPALAIEIPLEGFGKATSIAYVNMHKVFEAFPETEKARIELNLLIARKKEDITAKKEEIANLKAEMDSLKKQMTAVSPASGPKTSPPEAAEQNPGTGTPQSATSLTLPENSPLKFLFSPPQSTGTVGEPGKVSYSTFSKSSPEILPGIPSPGPSMMEKGAELSKKESELEVFVGTAEDEIRQAEEGKTMTLMARIYKSLEEIATKEGYSVVVDKENVLYGDKTIEITENLIWRLTNKIKSQ